MAGRTLFGSPKKLREDLVFAQRTRAAYLEVEKGNYIETSAADFLKKVRKV